MPRTDTLTRLQRLDRIAVQLKQGTPCTVADLARQFAVSPRTIARDLALMREQGLQIDADRGRGGGVRLDRHWGVGRLTLQYDEAVDLLISIAVAEKMDSPLFLARLGAVRRQLVASFAPDMRHRVEQLKSRILIGQTASPMVQSGHARPAERVVHNLHRAFIAQRQLEIRYRREDGTETTRVIEPHYLLLTYPAWYVVAFDHLRAAPRLFRADRVLAASELSAGFRLKPKSAFRPSLLAEDLLV